MECVHCNALLVEDNPIEHKCKDTLENRIRQALHEVIDTKEIL